MPTPTFDKSETFACRKIFVSNDTALNQTETARFSVSAYNFKGPDDYSLVWKVSHGEIVQGQGTSKIDVELNDVAAKRVTAFLEVGGLPYLCPKIFSATAEIRGKLHLIDDFGDVPNGDTKARLDNFLYTLQNNPMAKGYIIIYGNRAEANKDVARRTNLYNNHFRFRNFDVSRITVVRGGFREDTFTELWISFDDAEKPVPTPTVDKKFVVIPNQTIKPRPRKK